MKELEKNELVVVEGGIIPCLVVAGTIAFWGAAFYGAFIKGYNDAQK